jgi:hypothetical protein
MVGAGMGSMVGAGMGSMVGAEMGSMVGAGMGSMVGAGMGSMVGAGMGSMVGAGMGSMVGAGMGRAVGVALVVIPSARTHSARSVLSIAGALDAKFERAATRAVSHVNFTKFTCEIFQLKVTKDLLERNAARATISELESGTP